jgi:hypothetical protein
MTKSYRSKPTGWRQHSAEHSLAARGVRVYGAKRRAECDKAMFYAASVERRVPSESIDQEVRSGCSYDELAARHPESHDVEDLRRRGVLSIDGMEGDTALSELALRRDDGGIESADRIVELGKQLPERRQKWLAVLNDPQKASFVHPQKRAILLEGLRRI